MKGSATVVMVAMFSAVPRTMVIDLLLVTAGVLV